MQPGAEVSKEEYEKFKQFIRENRGTIRGNLGAELDNAMREYRQQTRATERLIRIEDDLATVKAAVVDGDFDGGGTVHPANGKTHTHTHTHPPTDDQHDPDDPPHPKATTKAKLDWLEAEVRRRSSDQRFSIQAVRKIIDTTWGFDDQLADSMVDSIVDGRLEAWSEATGTIGWGDS